MPKPATSSTTGATGASLSSAFTKLQISTVSNLKTDDYKSIDDLPAFSKTANQSELVRAKQDVVNEVFTQSFMKEVVEAFWAKKGDCISIAFKIVGKFSKDDLNKPEYKDLISILNKHSLYTKDKYVASKTIIPSQIGVILKKVFNLGANPCMQSSKADSPTVKNVMPAIDSNKLYIICGSNLYDTVNQVLIDYSTCTTEKLDTSEVSDAESPAS